MIGTLDQLLEFTQHINEVHPSIKSTFKFLIKKINFLDTVVYKTPTSKLIYKGYQPRGLFTLQITTSWVLKTEHIISYNIYVQLVNNVNEIVINYANIWTEVYEEQETNESIQRTQIFDRKELLKGKEKKLNTIPLIH